MIDIYERLRRRLDMFPQGFHSTKSGVELEILQNLFTEDEAGIMLSLRPFPEKISAIVERVGKDEKQLEDTLYSMSKRGLIMRWRAPDSEVYYFLVPWVVGIYEFQLNNLSGKNIDLFEKYYEEGMVPALRKSNSLGFRVIPIEKEIQAITTIQPYEKVSEIIDNNTVFAVAECICRKEQGILGKSCGRLVEACMVFGAAASYYIENGIGRVISKDEARQLLIKAEQEGLVHCSYNHSGKRMFICNCCGCCCAALKNITKYDNPAAIVKSNYYAVKDKEDCAVCGTCVKRCQANAIRIDDEVTIVDKGRCIGCGLCVSTCPKGSLSMAAKSVEEIAAIFQNEMEMWQAIGRNQGKTYPFE